MRQRGYDVIAKDTGGEAKVLKDVVENSFKGVHVASKTNCAFTRSRFSAAKLLVDAYGNNADGVCAIEWEKGGSHAFNWTIRKGNVAFYDGQAMLEPSQLHREYWRKIKHDGNVQYARLDDLKINEDGIRKYVENG